MPETKKPEEKAKREEFRRYLGEFIRKKIGNNFMVFRSSWISRSVDTIFGEFIRRARKTNRCN